MKDQKKSKVNPYIGRNKQELNASGFSLQEVEAWLQFQLDSIHAMQKNLEAAFKQLEDEEKSIQHD